MVDDDNNFWFGRKYFYHCRTPSVPFVEFVYHQQHAWLIWQTLSRSVIMISYWGAGGWIHTCSAADRLCNLHEKRASVPKPASAVELLSACVPRQQCREKHSFCLFTVWEAFYRTLSWLAICLLPSSTAAQLRFTSRPQPVACRSKAISIYW